MAEIARAVDERQLSIRISKLDRSGKVSREEYRELKKFDSEWFQQALPILAERFVIRPINQYEKIFGSEGHNELLVRAVSGFLNGIQKFDPSKNADFKRFIHECVGYSIWRRSLPEPWGSDELGKDRGVYGAPSKPDPLTNIMNSFQEAERRYQFSQYFLMSCLYGASPEQLRSKLYAGVEELPGQIKAYLSQKNCLLQCKAVLQKGTHPVQIEKAGSTLKEQEQSDVLHFIARYEMHLHQQGEHELVSLEDIIEWIGVADEGLESFLDKIDSGVDKYFTNHAGKENAKNDSGPDEEKPESVDDEKTDGSRGDNDGEKHDTLLGGQTMLFPGGKTRPTASIPSSVPRSPVPVPPPAPVVTSAQQNGAREVTAAMSTEDLPAGRPPEVSEEPSVAELVEKLATAKKTAETLKLKKTVAEERNKQLEKTLKERDREIDKLQQRVELLEEKITKAQSALGE